VISLRNIFVYFEVIMTFCSVWDYIKCP